MLSALLLASLSAAPTDLVALGVVLSPRPEASIAILRSGTRTRVVALGEMAFGGRVEAIAQTGVRLDFDGDGVEVRLGPPTAATGSAAPDTAAPRRLADPDARSREMARAEVEQRLAAETPRILAETALVPVQDEERVVGFALTRIPEGSLLTDLGLRPGDVLTNINDVPIDSFATLMGLWPRLQNETQLRAILLRDGRPISLSVTLR